MRLLLIGDIVGKPGRHICTQALRGLRAEENLDLIVANAENAAAGSGLTPEIYRDLLAAGIDGMDHSVRSVPFVVATQCFSLARLHLGGIRTEQRNRWFVGADTCFSDKWTFMADYVGGDENGSSLGVNHQVNDAFGVCIGLVHPNAGDGEVSYTIDFVFGGSFRKRHCPEGE